MRRRAALALCLTAALVCASPAQSDTTVTRTTLSNGLQVVVVRDTLAPVVTTVMNYMTGSAEEDITGLAHATEHMMFRGSKTLSASQFADVIAVTGGHFNASTQNQVTQYYFTMPSQDLDIALRLEASRARDVLDSEAGWDEERGAITQEVTRDNSSAEYRLRVEMVRNLLSGTPYAEAGLGTVDGFAHQVNASTLQRFYGTWYHPNNALLVVAGDVDPKDTIRRVRRYFGSIPSVPLPERKPVQLQPLQPATYRDESDRSYTLAMVGYRFPGTQDPDYAAGQVLAEVLNSHRAQLFGLVTSGRARFCRFSVREYPQAGAATASIGEPTGSSPEDAATLLRGVVDHYRQVGVPGSLVDVAKRRIAAAAEYQANSIEGLAFAWSHALAVEKRASPQDDVDAIQRVTPADVNRVLRQYLVNDTATIAYSVPNNQGHASSVAERTEEDNAVVPTEHKPLPRWARRVLSHLEVPPQTSSPVSTTLSNGIRLIVQPETVSHTVVLLGRIDVNPDLEEDPGTEGVAFLTDALLASGTTTYNRLQFQTQLDEIAADVSTGTFFGLSVSSHDFNRGVQLLADGELHPALRARDFQIVKQHAYEDSKGNEQTPGHLSALAMTQALYPLDDPIQRHSTPMSIQSLTLDQVQAWYNRAYRPDMTTIVVVGDVDPAQAQSTIETWFGEWQAQGPLPNTKFAPVPNNAPTSVVVPAQGRIQDAVELVETLHLTRDDPDFVPLELANTVLSGGFYASLLYHDLREVHGYVYTVGSGLHVDQTRGAFSIAFGAMPDKTNAATDAARAELRHLAAQPLSEDRLQRAKALFLGEIPIREGSYAGLGSSLLQYAALDLPLDEARRSAEDALTVTPAEVQAAVQRWFRPDGFVRVVQGPAPP